MQRFELQKNNLNPTFIGSWISDNSNFCSKIIDYFESNKSRQIKGVSLDGFNSNVIMDQKQHLHLKIISITNITRNMMQMMNAQFHGSASMCSSFEPALSSSLLASALRKSARTPWLTWRMMGGAVDGESLVSRSS